MAEDLPLDRRISVAEYHELIEQGQFVGRENFELIDGYITRKWPRTPEKNFVATMLEEILRAQLPSGWHLRTRLGVSTVDSETEPDIAIVRGCPRDYMSHHPFASDIALIAEVGEDAMEWDAIDKTRIYARAGVPCYWQVDIADRLVDAKSEPVDTDGGYYQTMAQYRIDDKVPLVFDWVEIAWIPVRWLLSPAPYEA